MEQQPNPQPLSGRISMTSHNTIVCVIGSHQFMSKKHNWAIVGEPLVPFDCIT